MTEGVLASPPQAGSPLREAEYRLEAGGLTKRYGDTTAVEDLTLEIRAGEVFGLLGPNGAGKTTTILMLLGLTEPTAGWARVCGLDPARDALAVRRRVGYLPDDVGFYGNLTGRENLRYTARLNRLPPAAAEERIADLIERVGLAEAADRRADTYSRGMRQRLGIADALVKNPDVVVLDEPTAAIDPRGVVEVLDLVRTLAEEGAAVLLSSHLLHQVQATCDRVGIFVHGRMVAQGTVDDLAAQLGTSGVRIELEVDGEGDVPDALRALPSVTAIEPDPAADGRRWLIRSSRDDRAEIAKRLATSGLPVTHLRRRGDDLDEIYLRYFAGREPAGAAGGEQDPEAGTEGDREEAQHDGTGH